MPLRVKAAAVGLTADEYHALDVVPVRLDRDVRPGGHLDRHRRAVPGRGDRSRGGRELPCHTGLRLTGGGSAALGRVTADKRVRLVRGDREAFGLHGRSAEQRVALDLLLDPEIGIVSLGGRAGTGKSALALCAGLEAVLERQQHRKVVVFRPLYAVGGQELGYLPGSESEKMAPWAQAVFDTLGALVSQDTMDEVVARGMLEVLPLTHIRGRSLHDSFVIVDEAQSLERNVLLTVLSRLGTASRVVLTHDVAQRDNLRVGRHDGVAAVIEKLKGHPLFAHVTLTRSERSPIAALVTEMLEGESRLTRLAGANARSSLEHESAVRCVGGRQPMDFWPSRVSRMMSAWPACWAVSAMMCMNTRRADQRAPGSNHGRRRQRLRPRSGRAACAPARRCAPPPARRRPAARPGSRPAASGTRWRTRL